MRPARLAAVVAAVALAAPGLARADASPGSAWSVTLSVWGGFSSYDVLGLGHGVESLD
jgi:hypothetical protein